MVITHGPTGQDLRDLRKRAGLRQQDVADLMGVVRPRVAHIEGMYHPPRMAVARYLDAVKTAELVPA